MEPLFAPRIDATGSDTREDKGEENDKRQTSHDRRTDSTEPAFSQWPARHCVYVPPPQIILSPKINPKGGFFVENFDAFLLPGHS